MNIESDSHLQSTGRVIQVIFVATHRVSDQRDNLRRCACQRTPARGQDSYKLDLIGCEVSKELHGEQLAHGGARAHQTRVREVAVCERNKMRADDEARVDDGHVLKPGIFEDERAHDREVDVRCGELSDVDIQLLLLSDH